MTSTFSTSMFGIQPAAPPTAQQQIEQLDRDSEARRKRFIEKLDFISAHPEKCIKAMSDKRYCEVAELESRDFFPYVHNILIQALITVTEEEQGLKVAEANPYAEYIPFLLAHYMQFINSDNKVSYSSLFDTNKDYIGKFVQLFIKYGKESFMQCKQNGFLCNVFFHRFLLCFENICNLIKIAISDSFVRSISFDKSEEADNNLYRYHALLESVGYFLDELEYVFSDFKAEYQTLVLSKVPAQRYRSPFSNYVRYLYTLFVKGTYTEIQNNFFHSLRNFIEPKKEQVDERLEMRRDERKKKECKAGGKGCVVQGNMGYAVQGNMGYAVQLNLSPFF